MPKLLLYLLIVFLTLLLLVLVFVFMVRPWYLRWGATDAELSMPLPGDDLVTLPLTQPVTTRAITIDAPVDQVYPWLAQMGADKGGLYSYEKLENLIGCKMTNANSILSEFQNPQPGDAVKMCGGDFGPPAYIVALVKPGEYIILGHHPQPEEAVESPDEWTDSWAFVLQPVDANATRLLIRTRATMSHWIFKVIEPITFFMERGMMYGIKTRAEQ